MEVPVVIPYWGGKNKLSKQFVPLIPPHRHYMEVFAGGLSMFFRKSKSEWSAINDVNDDLINLYLVVENKLLFDQFIEKVKWTIKSRAYYSGIRDKIRNKEFDAHFPDVNRAFDYFYFIRNSFNSRLDTAFSKDTTGWTTRLRDSLWESRKKLNGVIIEHLDYKTFVEKYYKKEESFWYFDPPYVVADTEKYYHTNFNKNEHIIMKGIVDFLNDIAKAKIMISYDDHKLVRQLYGNDDRYMIKEFESTYAGNRQDPGKKFTELLIMNYKPTEQMGLEL